MLLLLILFTKISKEFLLDDSTYLTNIKIFSSKFQFSQCRKNWRSYLERLPHGGRE